MGRTPRRWPEQRQIIPAWSLLLPILLWSPGCPNDDPTELPCYDGVCDDDDSGDDDTGDDDSTEDPCADGDCDGDGWTVDGGDCDDHDPTAYPGAEDVCGDEDSDCDGETDPLDLDGDGDGYTPCDGDCDDADPDLHPGVDAVICNGVDDDCLSGAERHVPQDYGTIQEGLDAAGHGDTVCVAPGVYTENLQESYWLRIVGTGGADVTFIDAGGTGAVLTAYDVLDGLLRGLTLEGGDSQSGCVEFSDSVVTIEDLTVAHNEYCGWGALAATGSELSLTNVTVDDNSGDGIAAWESDIEIVGSIVSSNTGDGIETGATYLDVENSFITQNGGMGLFVYGHWHHKSPNGTVRVKNCVIADNSSDAIHHDSQWHGGEGVNLNVTHAVLSGNGRGIYAGCGAWPCAGSTAVSHSIIHGNQRGIILCAEACYSQSATDVYGNVEDYSGIDDLTGLDYNVSVAPAFADATHEDPLLRDYHLQTTSPLVDAGYYFSSDPDGGLPDIGAFGGTLADDWDLDGDGFPAWWHPGPYDPAVDPAAGWDCNDLEPTAHPGGIEVTGNGIDEDCDGFSDETPTDADGDGAETGVDCDDTDPSMNLDDADGDGFDTCSGDCDDSNSDLYPGAPELCDLLDSDCDGIIGPAEADTDGDGWGICQGDCDDANAAVHPAAIEACNGVDDDCDGTIPNTEVDGDSDGLSTCEGDCDDADPTLNLDDADGDGADSCSGDCDDTDPTLNLLDADGDGDSTCDGDCDDADPSVHPGAIEDCNGQDDDCDGVIPGDETDGDGDGQPACAGDCDDADPATYLGASELCDGLDNDCDGTLPLTEADADQDGWMACEGDCDDTDPSAYPGNGC